MISGVSDSPLLMELGVEEGVVDEGNIPDEASTSIFTGTLPGNSRLRLMAAVVSVGYKQIMLEKHSLYR